MPSDLARFFDVYTSLVQEFDYVVGVSPDVLYFLKSFQDTFVPLPHGVDGAFVSALGQVVDQFINQVSEVLDSPFFPTQQATIQCVQELCEVTARTLVDLIKAR